MDKNKIAKILYLLYLEKDKESLTTQIGVLESISTFLSVMDMEIEFDKIKELDEKHDIKRGLYEEFNINN